MTKRELLLMVCENPGWEPPDSNGTERHLDELLAEGWITTRLDGWAATSKAMDAFPDFAEQPDVAEPTLRERAEHRCVPQQQVAALLAGVLRELPIVNVMAIVAGIPSAHPQIGPEWEIAVHLAERMGDVPAL